MAPTGTDSLLDQLVDAAGHVLSGGSPAGVTLWIADLAALPDAIPVDRTALAPEEIEAAARRPAAIAARYVRRRLVRRALLAAHAGMDVADVEISSPCARCGHPTHGKPSLARPPGRRTPVEFNTASSGDSFVVAVSDQPVGVDIERGSRIDEALAARLDTFTTRRWPALQAALPSAVTPTEAWTAGEAISKGIGLGLWATDDEMAAALAEWRMQWMEPVPDLVACVATMASSPTIVVRWVHDLTDACHLEADPRQHGEGGRVGTSGRRGATGEP